MPRDIKKLFQPNEPVLDLFETVDYIFAKLTIDLSVFRNPSYLSDAAEMLAGLTNPYLQQTRIGRKAVFREAIFFYGRKIHLLPEAFEIVPFDAPQNIFAFIADRIKKTLTDYFSIHYRNSILDVDLKDGVISHYRKIGFDNEFGFIVKGKALRVDDLERIITRFVDK